MKYKEAINECVLKFIILFLSVHLDTPLPLIVGFAWFWFVSMAPTTYSLGKRLTYNTGGSKLIFYKVKET